MSSTNMIENYLSTLQQVVANCVVQGSDIQTLHEGLRLFIYKAVQAHKNGNKVIFVGNGGSAGICSHMATDYSKNGGIRSMACNDGAVLTCLSNDYGYVHVFAKQIEWHARPGDIVVAISSSGKSQNILNATDAAKEKGCFVTTLSGFGSDNPLREKGDINFYLDSKEYGFVEVGHLTLLHLALDLKEKFLQEMT